nr:fatty acid--CoA ligase family protein [Leifsonia psychrotolerans]
MSRGPLSLTLRQLEEQIAARRRHLGAVTARLIPLSLSDPVELAVSIWAVRESGGIPLAGDDRWETEFWARQSALAAAAIPPPGAAWAAFSSGSSGNPRVILRSEHSWAASFPWLSTVLAVTDDDTLYLPVPTASSLTLFSLAYARAVGAAVRFPPGHTVSPGDLAHVTVLHGTPNSLQSVVDAIESGVPHRLRLAVIGGATLPPSLRERAESAGLRVVSYYGAAELSFVAFDPDGLGLRAVPGVETRVDDGALWVRSPTIALGYLADALGSLRRDDSGWATVGDLVTLHPHGILRLAGRGDGAILTAAATVIPEDVEAGLRSLPGVADAVVFELPGPRDGSLVAAAVELSVGSGAPTLRELREQAKIVLATSHLPRIWFGPDSLPRTLTGKPARAQIRRDALDGKLPRLG